jgi:hypothetical protein
MAASKVNDEELLTCLDVAERDEQPKVMKALRQTNAQKCRPRE